jgi:hypothetical protein
MIIASYCGRRGLDRRLFAISCGKGNPAVPYIVILIDTTALCQVKIRHILIFPAEQPQNLGLSFSEAGGRISEFSGTDGSRKKERVELGIPFFALISLFRRIF